MKHAPTNRKGMTLIEVLVAMVILSVGVSALMMAMSKCLSVVRTARHLDNARTLIRLVELENPIINKDLEEQSDAGSFDDYEEFKGYRWEREITLIDEEERPGLFLITTRIIWSQSGRSASQEATTYRYAPDAESVTRKIK